MVTINFKASLYRALHKLFYRRFRVRSGGRCGVIVGGALGGEGFFLYYSGSDMPNLDGLGLGWVRTKRGGYRKLSVAIATLSLATPS